MFEDTNDTLDFMGGVKWHSENQRTKVAYAISVGPQDPPADFNNIPGDQDRFVVQPRDPAEALRATAVRAGAEPGHRTERADHRQHG